MKKKLSLGMLFLVMIMSCTTAERKQNSVYPMVGTIVPFALVTGNIPDGWLICDGSAVPATRPLFQYLKNTPDLRGRALIGTGAPVNSVQSDGSSPNFDSASNWTLGYTGGEYRHTLSTGEMPRHNHTIYGGNFGIHDRSFEGKSGDNDWPFEISPAINLNGTDSTGGGQPHNNMQPYYAVNYLIYAGPSN